MSFRKPDSDKRNYRLITLDNEMEICLVSDPETMIAAAALAVKAGQLQDPPEVQGLAHFCEHMLFLGNEKFPGESDFDAFCASSAGYSNAWTSMDRTVYHYMLAHDRLSDSLDRFSGFFSCPLFTEDLTERELNAIESENNKNLQDDSRREHQLWRSTAKAGHPVQRFGTGNFKTLSEMPKEAGTNVREHLLRFHESCYSANVMTLSVLGREDLDTLEALVRQHFSAVPNRKLAPLAGVSPTDSAFDDGWKQLYRIVPVRERRKLCLFFPMPPTYPDFRVKMCRFISHCIGHEGPGSVLSALKARNLATELGAGTATQSTYYSLFEVSVKLTEEGLPRWEEAVSLIFQYLNSFVRDAPRAERDRIRRECTLMEELNFRFRSKAREDNFTEQLACNLSRYPRELGAAPPPPASLSLAHPPALPALRLQALLRTIPPADTRGARAQCCAAPTSSLTRSTTTSSTRSSTRAPAPRPPRDRSHALCHPRARSSPPRPAAHRHSAAPELSAWAGAAGTSRRATFACTSPRPPRSSPG